MNTTSLVLIGFFSATGALRLDLDFIVASDP